MFQKLREKINIFVARSPKKAVLIGIMVFNVIFITIAAGIIAILSQYISGLKQCGFWESVFHTITMMLDAGCIESVVNDVGKAGAVAAIVCIIVVLVGMILLTGAIVGFITNSISDFIESKNNGRNKLYISDHIVIINWNARATEILNELLYANRKIKVVVFVHDHKEEIEKTIRNRLDTALLKELKQVREAAKDMSPPDRKRYLKENLIADQITYIVREGDIAAATDLDDICISKAKTVIILEDDTDKVETAEGTNKGSTQTIRTLIQVSEISKGDSNQTILVEASDLWSEDLIGRIIDFKGARERIIPISHNSLLGKTMSQIVLMPELFDIYDLLFSGGVPHFVTRTVADGGLSSDAYVEKQLAANCCSVPLMLAKTSENSKAFFVASDRCDTEKNSEHIFTKKAAKLKKETSYRGRNLIVLGHNSNMDSLMEGFDIFRKNLHLEEKCDRLNIIMIDNEESLLAHDMYENYPYVKALAADVYDEDTVIKQLYGIAEYAPKETTVLILSDDQADNEDIDADVLTYLIYIQGHIRMAEENDPEFDRKNLQVIVEIRNPKNEDIVKSYGADKVIISNRYVGNVISQICLDESEYELFINILSYNSEDSGKKIFPIPAEDFFEEIPGKCSAAELIRMIFAGGTENNRCLLLGYIRDEKEYVLFSGDQRQIEVDLRPDDKLILFNA